MRAPAGWPEGLGDSRIAVVLVMSFTYWFAQCQPVCPGALSSRTEPASTRATPRRTRCPRDLP